ncbi:MAG: DNA polymerase III subunit delta' [Bacteroidales bacterium]|jgi:DNA polymerase-3 subunit delta'|nr:DNA polymerase III subunit delta' [Bacteroidales bacterium]
MNFSQIPGQSAVINRLRSAVAENRVSHALLFYGPEGSGKFALALAFARFISCEKRSADDACGICPSCSKYDKLIHPDLHFVFPVIKKKSGTEPVSDTYISQWREMVRKSPYFSQSKWTEAMEVANEQALIPVAEAAEIIRKLSLKSFESDYKIMIIWLPEKMNPETANKLLKMIEEPPAKTVFILVSEEDDRLLPTITSRCQHIRIPAIASDDMSKYLVQEYGIVQTRAEEIAGIANGNMVRATELAREDDNTAVHLERFIKLMRTAYARDIQSVIAWSEETAALGRERQKSFLSYALRLVRENFIMNFGGKENKLVYLTQAEEEFSARFYPFINVNNIHALDREFNLAYAHVESNGNTKMIFLDLALRTMRLIR